MDEGDPDVEFETERIDGICRLYDGFANMRDSLGTSDRVAEHADAVDALDGIAGYAEWTNGGGKEISAATEQQAASTRGAVAGSTTAAIDGDEDAAESESDGAEFEWEEGPSRSRTR